jgi:hypothetical protein
VGDRILKAWRAVRRPDSGTDGFVAAVAGRDDGFARTPRRRSGRVDSARFCGASGWHMRAGCTDGDGGTICPMCSQRVRTEPRAGGQRRVEVIQAHTA